MASEPMGQKSGLAASARGASELLGILEGTVSPPDSSARQAYSYKLPEGRLHDFGDEMLYMPAPDKKAGGNTPYPLLTGMPNDGAYSSETLAAQTITAPAYPKGEPSEIEEVLTSVYKQAAKEGVDYLKRQNEPVLIQFVDPIMMGGDHVLACTFRDKPLIWLSYKLSDYVRGQALAHEWMHRNHWDWDEECIREATNTKFRPMYGTS